MTDLPAPLTTSDCDLRGFDFMPLFGHRLFRSELYEHSDGEEFKVAVKLWWEAWNQCPAGSLPNDDSKLCRLADLGRDIKTWRKIRDAALRGFVLCSDGRLYHRHLCEWAMEAYERRVRERERKRKWRNRDSDGTGGGGNAPRPRDNPTEGRGQPHDATGTNPQNDGDNPRDNGTTERLGDGQRLTKDRRGQDRRGEESKKDSKNLRSELVAPRACLPPPDIGADTVGEQAASAVVVALQRGLRMTAYPPRKAIRSPSEQIEQVAQRPKPSRITPEQLAAIRQQARKSA